MKKLDDFIAAGTIMGLVANVFSNLLVLALTGLGLKIRTPWNDMAALYFKPPYTGYISAQIFGVIANYLVAAVNGIIVSGLLRFTGRDFAYLKSIGACLLSFSFAFLILYPSLGLKADQHSIPTTYTAFFGNVFFGALLALLLPKYTHLGKPREEEW